MNGCVEKREPEREGHAHEDARVHEQNKEDSDLEQQRVDGLWLP